MVAAAALAQTSAPVHEYRLENTTRWNIEPRDVSIASRRSKNALSKSRPLNQRQKRKNTRRAIAAGFTK